MTFLCARIDLKTRVDIVLLARVDRERHLTQVVSVGKVASSRMHVRDQVLIGALNLKLVVGNNDKGLDQLTKVVFH